MIDETGRSPSNTASSDTERHCWFDFEDGYWTDDGESMPGHTCMLSDGHDGPHEPTSDAEILIGFIR